MALSTRRLSVLAMLVLLAALAPPALPARAATFTVTKTADTADGTCNSDCSLREAIAAANLSAGNDTILFAIPTSDAGYVSAGGASYWRIRPTTELPALSGGGTTIQGPAASDAPATATWPHPRIVLDGQGMAAPGANGLSITSANNVIRRLTIINFQQVSFTSFVPLGAGILIDGASADDNRVEGCYLGVAPDVTGSTSGNGEYGVRISGGASNNTIGGQLDSQRNVIAGNGWRSTTGRANVYVVGGSAGVISISNHIQNNYIGTNAAGTAQVVGGNFRDGVWVDERTDDTRILDNVIAGLNSVDREISGVLVDGGSTGTYPLNTKIYGNIFGLRADGQPSGVSALYNTNGVQLRRATNTVIGTPNAVDRNIISGSGYVPSGASYTSNTIAGVLVTTSTATGTVIEGNYIGLDVDGDPIGLSASLPIGNLGYGVNLTNNSVNTTVRGNVVANNQFDGVRVSSSSNVVQGNKIGTDVAGATTSTTLNNGNAGIRVDRGDNNRLLGNTVAIAPGALAAVLLKPFSNTSVTSTTIQGNFLGLSSGASPLTASPIANSAGLLVDKADSPATGITSQIAVVGNTIGGAENGVKIANLSGTSSLRGNTVGPNTRPSGIPSVTVGFGIWVINAPATTTIGGPSAGDGNTVSGSGSHGVYLDGSGANGITIANNLLRDNAGDGVNVRAATGVVIDRTATRTNAGAGIGLSQSGNADMPAPTFPASPFTATPSPSLTVNVSSARCAGGCTVQVFTSTTSDPGEGPRYLAQATVAPGGGSVSVPVPACDRYLTATVRDTTTGNTSPFAATMVDTTTGCAAASVTLSGPVRISPAGTGPVAPGTAVVYQYTVTNSGGLPASITVTRGAGLGWAGAPTPSSFTVSAGTPQTFQITVNVPAGAAGGTVDSFLVTASGGSTPQSVTTTTTVAQTFGVQIDAEAPQDQPFNPATGGTLTFTHVVTNTGNGPDSFSFTTVTTPTLGGVTVTPLPAGSCTGVAAGASCRVQVSVPIPAAPVASYDIAVTAASSSPSVRDTALNRAIGAAAAPGLSPLNQTRAALPGETVVFTRTITNIGNQSGTFTPTLTVVSPPAGWSAALDSTAPSTLAAGATRVVTHTATVPLATAPLSGTVVVGRVDVASSDGLSASGEDRVLVRLLPSFELDAAATPLDAAPGATVTFTHTLRNTSNGPDRYTVVVTPTAGLELVSVTPASPVLIGVGSQANVVVRARVRDLTAPGAQSLDVTAQTVSSPKPAPVTRTDTVNVLATAGVSLSPAQTQPALSVPATITFTHVLTNVGNVAGDFTVTPSVVGAPAGWSAAAADPNSCLSSLASGATCSFVVVVTVPGSPLPQNRGYGVLIDVTTSGAAGSVTDTVSVGPIARVELAPDRAGSTAPDAQIEYTHTLTNSGNVTATFTLSASTPPAGWTAQVVPATLPSVPPGATQTVRLRVTPPPNAAAGGPVDVQLTALSSVAPNPTAVVTDSTTVLSAPSARLTPPTQSRSVFPTPAQSDTATFPLTLANSGNTVISYTLGLVSLTGGPAWTALITPTATDPLPADVSAARPVTVTVTAPAGASGARAFLVEARRGDTGDLLATATITATASGPLTDLLTPAENRGNALPNGTVVYTHTLRNVRGVADTYQLSYVAPFGWQTTVAPSSVFLPAGATSTITVSLRVPTNVLSGTLDITTLTATSLADPSVTGSAEERTTVGRVFGSSLSPRFVQLAQGGDSLEFRHTLVNIGNATDTFDLSVSDTLGWGVTVTPSSTQLARSGFDSFITVRVQVPQGAALGSTNRITVRATSRGAPAQVSSVENIVALPQPAPVTVEYPTYLPVVWR